MPEKAKIFLVDDHPLVREWLTTLVNQQLDLVICGEAEDAPNALRGISSKKPDVAIVDISLKEGGGLELIKSIRLHAPHTAVIILSMHEEKLYAERAIRAGARGYVMKSDATKRILDAIHQVLQGKLFLSDHMASSFAEKYVGGHHTIGESPIDLLSDRELEVFTLIGRGCDTRRVAETLNVSIKTVQAYCARIKQKLKLSTATELLREAIRWNEQ